MSGKLYEYQHAFFIISRSVLLRMRNVSDKRCTEPRNTHFMVNNFFFENLAVYEIMWKNIVERGRPQMTIWRMRFACWITKATNTHSAYVILTASQLHERASMLRYCVHYLIYIFMYVCVYIYLCMYVCVYIYIGCPRSNVPDFERVFLMLKYTDITQDTYVQS